MKFFTRGWTAGEYDDASASQIRTAYWARVEALRTQMPSSVAELATATELHDALVDLVVWNRKNGTLEVRLICGSATSGCFGLRLSYLDVQISDLAASLLAECVRDRRTQVLYDEVDRDDDGKWIHRLLFWPFGETSIWFGALELARAGRPDKRWEHVGRDPFVMDE